MEEELVDRERRNRKRKEGELRSEGKESYEEKERRAKKRGEGEQGREGKGT